MNIKNVLHYYKSECDRIIQLTDDIKAVKGTLSVYTSNNTTQFRYCYQENGKRIRKYITKKNKKLIRDLAQAQYLREMRRTAIKLNKLIEPLSDMLSQNIFETVYRNTCESKKEYISPIVDLYENRVMAWHAKPYIIKGFKESDKEIYTNRRMRVRSKTERRLAEMFDSYGLKYKYEYPIFAGTKRYVDFVFLSPITNREVYWEHFGMMSDPAYAVNTYKKIIEYDKAGIRLGENFIATFEDINNDLDYEYVRMMIQRYLILPILNDTN